MHILFIRFSSLGDIVLQTPMISWIKLLYPDSKVTFLTSSEFTGLLEGHPHLDNVIGMPRFKNIFKLKSYVQALNNENNIDLIIDLHGTTRSFFTKLFLPFVKKISMDKRRFERWLLVNGKINLLKSTESIHSRHIVDLHNILGHHQNIEDLSSFINLNKNVENNLRLTSSPLAYSPSKRLFDGRYIVLSPVASFAPKRWPIEYFNQLAKMLLKDKELLNYKIIVLAGPKDDYCKVLNKLEDEFQSRFFNLQGKTSLIETMEILKFCDLCIGNDTGLNHISEACSNSVITIFGPTHESLGFKASLDKSKNISVDLKCRPCSTTGKKSCKYSEQLCMTKILPEMIFKQAKTILLESKY